MARTIAIAGKGGTGKTTIAGLIVRYLNEHTDGPILAIDADPDSNFADVLGIRVEKTIGDLREETLKAMKNFPPGTSKEVYINAGLHELIAECGKIDMIVMGRGEGPGCYCYINNILRKFAEDLEPSYKWIVIDNEAGLEHLNRRVTFRVDELVVVVNASPLSVDCAFRVAKLLTQLRSRVEHRYIVANSVTVNHVERIKESIKSLDFTWLGWLPHDDVLEQAMFERKSILTIPETPAIEIMNKIILNMKLCCDKLSS
jgi:CO dehydrogenase maturation factor